MQLVKSMEDSAVRAPVTCVIAQGMQTLYPKDKVS